MKKLFIALLCLGLITNAFAMEELEQAKIPDSEYITFELPDGATETIQKKFVVLSATLRGMIEDVGHQLPAPQLLLDAKIEDKNAFDLIKPYFKWAYLDAAKELDRKEDKLNALRAQLSTHSTKELIGIVDASNYLDIPLILTEARQILTNRLKHVDSIVPQGNRLELERDMSKIIVQSMLEESPLTRNMWHLRYQRLMNQRELPIKHIKGHDWNIKSVRYSTDGKKIISGSDDGTVVLWNPKTGQKIGRSIRTEVIPSSVFVNDECTRLSYFTKLQSDIETWDISSDNFRRSDPPRINIPLTRDVCFSPTGQHFARSEFVSNQIHLCDMQGNRIGTMNGHTDHIRHMCFNHDGSRLASASHDGSVLIWDTATHTQIKTPLQHSATVQALSFNRDGTLLASISDSKVYLWDTKNHAQIATFGPQNPHRDSTGALMGGNAICFSPDGSMIAAVYLGTICLWDTKTLTQLAAFYCADRINSICFSPDGTSIAFGANATERTEHTQHETYFVGVCQLIDPELARWFARDIQPEHMALLTYARDGRVTDAKKYAQRLQKKLPPALQRMIAPTPMQRLTNRWHQADNLERYISILLSIFSFYLILSNVK